MHKHTLTQTQAHTPARTFTNRRTSHKHPFWGGVCVCNTTTGVYFVQFPDDQAVIVKPDPDIAAEVLGMTPALR